MTIACKKNKNAYMQPAVMIVPGAPSVVVVNVAHCLLIVYFRDARLLQLLVTQLTKLLHIVWNVELNVC